VVNNRPAAKVDLERIPAAKAFPTPVSMNEIASAAFRAQAEVE